MAIKSHYDARKAGYRIEKFFKADYSGPAYHLFTPDGRYVGDFDTPTECWVWCDDDHKPPNPLPL